VRDPLLLAVAQPSGSAHDVAANAAAHAALVRTAGARVVVFPELSLTGYELDAAPVAVDDPRLAPLVDACATHGAVALAGAPVAGADGSDHIGVLAVDGTGARVAYRKMFLGGAEPERFAPGSDPGVVEVDGWRLGLAVCKDTGVPEQAAATAAQGVDAYVAGVLELVDDVAVIGRRATRIAADHHLWVAVASFAGATGGGYDRAAGCSGVWAPGGREVVRAGAEVGTVVVATLT
jgi:predicted amidohydrolase